MFLKSSVVVKVGTPPLLLRPLLLSGLSSLVLLVLLSCCVHTWNTPFSYWIPHSDRANQELAGDAESLAGGFPERPSQLHFVSKDKIFEGWCELWQRGCPQHIKMSAGKLYDNHPRTELLPNSNRSRSKFLADSKQYAHAVR